MDGIILIDKPAGVTSHDVVHRVRAELGGRKRAKVGHAGTLDPFATGLLVVLVGRATRAQRFFMALPKAYDTRVRFGWTSTTGDPEGELTHTGRVPRPPLALPTGTLRQRPHAYSAVKVDGERAYARARRGEEVELAPREVQVHAFAQTAPDAFHIECSAGTYVRSLVADLGDAYCLTLRRTRIGPFDVADASAAAIPLGDALARFLPVLDLEPAAAGRAAHGTAVPGPAGDPVVLLRDADGPIALAEPRGPGELKPIVGFRG